MGKSTTFDGQLLALIFNGTGIANIADNAASTPLTNLWVALHTADPTAAGNQTSSECNYTSYARVSVARSSSGWTVSGSSVSPVAQITFPQGTGGSGTAAFWSVGTAQTGTGEILYSGSITPTIATGSGITPILTTSSVISEN
jgi:hypothetical protein